MVMTGTTVRAAYAFKRTQLRRVLEVLGLEDEDVRGLNIYADKVMVERFVRAPDGHLMIEPDGKPVIEYLIGRVEEDFLWEDN